MKKTVTLFEVAIVIGLFFFIRLMLRGTPFADWQIATFGSAPLSSSLLLFVLPLMFLLALRCNPGTYGLSMQRLNYNWRVALRALMVVAPATTLFPVTMLLGSDPMQWLGGIILAIGFAIAGFVMTGFVRSLSNEPEAIARLNDLLIFVGLLAVGLVLMALLNPFAPLLARMVMVVLFAGLLEEVFFRGYVQSKLNEVFGRPFHYRGVNFGFGLLIASAIFGLMHPLTSPDIPTPWVWALWTMTMGLVFGYLREKTGSIVASSIVHGVILLPGVLFGSI